MEPVSFTMVGLGVIFGQALLHYFVAKGGDKTFDIISEHLNNSRIKNHDVDRAIKDSFLYVTKEIKNQCLNERFKEKFIIEREFLKINNFAENLVYGAENSDPENLISFNLNDLMAYEKPGELMAISVLDKSGVADPYIKKVFTERFSNLFLFAFKEIGLKSRPKVNVVLTHEILREIHGQLKRQNEELNIDAIAILDKLKFQSEFQSMMNEKLTEITNKISKISSLPLNYRTFAINKDSINGFIILFKGKNILSFYPCNVPLVTVGRQLDNLIWLPDIDLNPMSSRYHAEIHFYDTKVVLKDISQNGTTIRNELIHKQTKDIHWGDKLEIGNFTLALSSDLNEYSLNYDVQTHMWKKP